MRIKVESGHLSDLKHAVARLRALCADQALTDETLEAIGSIMLLVELHVLPAEFGGEAREG